MAVTASFFQSALDQSFQGAVNYPADSIKLALLTPAATPSLSSWVHYSDLANEVANGNGYTTGGVALTGKTHTQTAANSWSATWTATNPQNVGDIIRPTVGNGYLYQCAVAGTTAGSQPTFPTPQGNTVTDGTVTWWCLGQSVTVWTSASAQWTSATFSYQYGVIYDAQSGVGSTEALIALINLGSAQSVSAGTVTLSPPANGWFVTAAG